MNIGQILGWVTQNWSVVTTIITIIQTLASDLQNLHGVSSISAWAQAALHAIESLFTSLGATTTSPDVASSTVASAKAAVSAAVSQQQQVQAI